MAKTKKEVKEPKVRIFTEAEIKGFKLALEQGGKFVHVYKQRNKLAEIYKADGNGGWELMQVIGKDTTVKLYKVFMCKDFPAPYTSIGLKWMLDEKIASCKETDPYPVKPKYEMK